MSTSSSHEDGEAYCPKSATTRILPALVWTKSDKTERWLREGLTLAGWRGGQAFPLEHKDVTDERVSKPQQAQGPKVGRSLPIIPQRGGCCRLIRILHTKHLYPTYMDIYHTTRSIVAGLPGTYHVAALP